MLIFAKLRCFFVSRLSILPILLILFCGLIFYANAVAHPFVHDDLVFIKNNPAIADLSDVPKLFLTRPQTSQRLAIANSYYRPLLEVLYRLQFRAFGLNPHWYHLFNILLHITNAVLAFLFLRGISRRSALSLAAALVFLLHPVQTEAVACISGVSNLLFVFLCLSALLLYHRLRCLDPARIAGRAGLGAVAGLIYVAALFVKEQAIVLPFLLLLYEWCFVQGKKEAKARVWPVMGAFFLLTVMYLSWRHYVLGAGILSPFGDLSELSLRLLAVPRTLLMYSRVIVWPFDLHYYRSIDILASNTKAFFCLFFLAALMFFITRGLLRRASREEKALAFLGAGWFFITLLPVLNIMPLVHEYSFIAAFEHFLYLPLLGLAFLFMTVGWRALSVLYRKERVAIARAGMLIVVLLFGLGTIAQNRYWRQEVPLFERAVRFEGRVARVRVLLGKAYYFAGNFSAASRELTIARTIMKGYLAKTEGHPVAVFYRGFIKGIEFDLAHCYEAQGKYKAALFCYERIIELDPNDGIIYSNAGLACIHDGDIRRAKEYFQRAVDLRPQDLMARNNLAICYIKEGDRREAQRLLREILAVNAAFNPARQNLQQLLSEF